MISYCLVPVIVPLLAALFVLVCHRTWPLSFKQGAGSRGEIELNRRRYVVFFAVCVCLCAATAGFMAAGAVSKVRFHEVWNMKVVRITHEEQWTTRERRQRQVPSGRDSKGHTRYRTEYYYVTATHGPYWKAETELGGVQGISQPVYDAWKAKWGNERHTGTHEGSAAGFSRAISGGIFECAWPRTFETVMPAFEIHAYVNKLRVSNTVLMQYPKPTKELMRAYVRPADTGNGTPVLHYGGPKPSASDMEDLMRINAFYGVRQQVHTILVMFDGKAPRSKVTDILSAWQGPNKNELVTFAAVAGTNVVWCEVHSWMDNTEIHARLRDRIMGQPWSYAAYGAALQEVVPSLWVRKHFTPINEYLHIEVSPRWLIAAYVLSVAACVAAYYAIDKTVTY